MQINSLGTRKAEQWQHFTFKSDSFRDQPDIISSSYKKDLQFSQLF
jgi:hypothetical protein